MEKKQKLSRTWIETALSFKERNRLVLALLEISRNPTSGQIREKAKELFPERKDIPSLDSFQTWKRTIWPEILERIDAVQNAKFGA